MATSASGFLIKSAFGQMGNFELVAACRGGGFMHFWRDNDSPGFPWNGPQLFGCAGVSLPSLLHNSQGPFEVFARAGSRLVQYNREERWNGPKYFGSGVTGNPAVIQMHDGKLHMVVPAAGGGFAEFQRAADPASPWQNMPGFGVDAGQATSVALIQGNFGDPGNLEMIAVMGSGAASYLAHFWRSNGTWSGPNVIGLPAGAVPSGAPAFLQGKHGAKGNFEVVVPLSTGGLAHLRRDNDSADLHWEPPKTFGTGNFTGVGMLQSNFGSAGPGNLELIACAGDHLEHYWCDDQSLQWNGPTAVIHAETVTNPAVTGEWRVEHWCEPVGIHAALLHTNKVLFFAYERHDQTHGVSSVFNLEDGTVQHVPQDEDLFCAGHAFLPDGRLLVSGGHVTGEKSLFIFNPSGNAGSWQQLPDMPVGRWYPTCTTLPDGSIFILSGSKKTGGGEVNDTYQIYTDATGLQPPQQVEFLNETHPYNTYPWDFVLPSGKLFVFSANRACLFDIASKTFGPERITTLRFEPRTYPLEGTCVLLPLLPNSNPPYRARVMVCGGGGLPQGIDTPASNACEILDLGAPALAWQAAASMSSPRVMPDAVLLPDGTVLVMNGSSAGKADASVNPVLETEIYNPATNAWTSAGQMRVPRLYHSSALLLPDATVLTAGLDEAFNLPPYHYPEYRLEVYYPAYLNKGPRPEIHTAPATINYGAQFQVTCSGSIASAVLIRNGAVTHSFNMDQRYVGLNIAGTQGGTITLEAPPNANIAPPGYYMLFVLNGSDVPSVAKFVNIA